MSGRPRRLCMVVHGPYPVGEPRVAREVRVALAEGFEVDVVAMRRAGEPAREVVEGARVLRLPLAHRRGAGALGVAAEYLGFTALASARVARLTLARRYDVVQVHNPPDFLVLAALVPKALGARVLLDVHDLAPDMFAMRFGERRGARVADGVLRRVERLAARAADAVITVHEPYRRELEARGVPAAKTTVVMNALDESLLPGGAREPGNGAFRVVYHGTVTPSYGVELLVEAAARVAPEVSGLAVEIYGEGDSVPRVRELATELGVADRVSVTGRYLPQRELLALIRSASVGVVPNLPTRLNRYALSSKLLEYAALEIPVVSADLPTIREHFSAAEVRFFRAGEAASLAEGLLEVARDPDAAAARARAARDRYEAYRWAVSARRYAEALGGSAPAPAPG